MILRFVRGSVVAAVFACCVAPSAMAEESKEGLVIYKYSGEKVSYILEERPVVTFVNDKLHVETSSVSADHDLTDVDKFSFENVLTGIESITEGLCRIYVNNNEVILQGFKPGCTVTMTDMEGRVVVNQVVGGTGEAVIHTGDLGVGVFVVATSDGKTFKLMNK